MRSYRGAGPARSLRPGTEWLTGALCIAHAHSNTDIHRDSHSNSYSHSHLYTHPDGYIYATATAAFTPTATATFTPTATATATATPTPTPTPTVIPGIVRVTATAGNTGPVDYPSVKAAFDAINAGTHQGAIDVAILSDTTEVARRF